MSSAHEEIRDEGEKRGVKPIDRRQICQQGKCHTWEEAKNENVMIKDKNKCEAGLHQQCVMYAMGGGVLHGTIN